MSKDKNNCWSFVWFFSFTVGRILIKGDLQFQTKQANCVCTATFFLTNSSHFSEKKGRRRLHEDEREIYPNGELSKAEEYKENLIKNLLPETGMTICAWGGGEMQYHKQRKFKYNRKWCWMSTGRWNDFLWARGKLLYGYLNVGSYLVLKPSRHLLCYIQIWAEFSL